MNSLHEKGEDGTKITKKKLISFENLILEHFLLYAYWQFY